MYSVLRAFELYDYDGASGRLRLEGIEDVDLIGLRVENEYVQVKTADKPWAWSRLKKPVTGFLEAHRANPSADLTLVVNFSLRDDIAVLAKKEPRSPNEERRITEKFHSLCGDLGASLDEADSLRKRLTIVSVPEEVVSQRLWTTVAQRFELGSEAVAAYVLAFIAQFLEWAKERKTVTYLDLEGLRTDLGEAMAREMEFQAYGRGLIDRISWTPDANPEDFFDGKGTRPGHIVAGLDVRRPEWMRLIDRAVKSAKVCALRASSGQGKSALLFRYAHDLWPAENVLLLRVAESYEQLQVIQNYLRFRARFGQPVLVLIDNAGWQTRLWPEVAKECLRLGFGVLVSVRSEDWYRFARESTTTYEVLEPVFDLVEARQIFASLRNADRLHPASHSAELAYERIGDRRRLMEFIFLLTRGRMLEERLRDQKHQFTEHGEDPAKTEILRRVALAQVLGTPVVINQLLADIPLRDDAQRVLQSLAGEYVRLELGMLTGLHWVRSDHLVRILHEDYPDEASTALAALDAIPGPSVPIYVSNALSRSSLEPNKFFHGLAVWAMGQPLTTLLAVADGVFEAGERRFIESHEALFDEVHERGGRDLDFLVGANVSPIEQVNILDQLAQLLGDRGIRFQELALKVSETQATPRGLDLVRDFLGQTLTELSPEAFQKDLGDVGRVLDWCALTGMSFTIWSDIKDSIVTNTEVFTLPLDSFCDFTQGLYRYDQAAYVSWFAQNQVDVLAYLRLYVDCLELDVSDETLIVKFLVAREGDVSPNDQAVSRLSKLRSAVPFCGSYRSQGSWLLPFGLSPSVDGTAKNISREKLSFQSDIDKNVVWRETVETRYALDSYYAYQTAWNEFRRSALLLVQRLSQGLSRRGDEGSRLRAVSEFGRGRLVADLRQTRRLLPSPPPQTVKPLADHLSQATSQWSNSLQNFLMQLSQYSVGARNANSVRLMVYNFRDALRYFSDVHAAFHKLFQQSPDYFGAAKLNSVEAKSYSTLADLLEVVILNPPKTPQTDILRYAKERRDEVRQERLRRLHAVVQQLAEQGMQFNFPQDLYVEYPLIYAPLAFSVQNPCNLDVERDAVIRILSTDTDIADIFWLVPTYQDARIITGGYHISADQISNLLDGRIEQWETLVPQPLPQQAFDLLPHLPLRPPLGIRLRSEVVHVLSWTQVCSEGESRANAGIPRNTRFDADLRRRYEGVFRLYRQELAATANRTKEELTIKFEDHITHWNSDLDLLTDALEMIMDALECHDFGALQLPKRLDIDAVMGAADRLLCRHN